jgi:TIR domain
MSTKYYLPSKITSYLKRLLVYYENSKENTYVQIIKSARIIVLEETGYDQWDGRAQYGHDVKFFLPISILGKIDVSYQDKHCSRLCKDLNGCAQSVENEFFRRVYFDLDDETDPEFQEAFPWSQSASANPDAITFWEPGQLRAFISHRDRHKNWAKMAASALEAYGISSFVAHDTIEPMTTWHLEIVKALHTMEVMIAFITDDFHESEWTNQELGFAIGKNIPVVPIKLESKDPAGFIATMQALKCRIDDPEGMAADVYSVIAEKLGSKTRLQGTLISAFLAAPDFFETKSRFDRMAGVITSLSDDELQTILEGFKNNYQLHNCYHLSYYNRMINFLEKTTMHKFEWKGKEIRVLKQTVDDQIPF